LYPEVSPLLELILVGISTNLKVILSPVGVGDEIPNTKLAGSVSDDSLNDGYNWYQLLYCK